MSSDSEVRKAAELKLWLEGRIAELQDEIGRLKETLGYVDATLRASAFTPASEMMAAKPKPEVSELRRDKGGQVLAKASVTTDRVSIEPEASLGLKSSTPPFKSFLIAKILEGMRSADLDQVAAGRLDRGKELRFEVDETNGTIRRLTVENYGQKARLSEILNTVSWTFSKMLEK